MNTLLDIIKEIECLLWAIVILEALYIVHKYYCLPKIQLNHERQMKADAFKREKEWYFIKEKEKSTKNIDKKNQSINEHTNN